ncbi:MAG TPA: hypothetical protein DEQ87_18535 [Algoriphagus sp.]|jgi:hypothetical protein|uniref:DUF4221 family protein n=1 Tax=unclassified Algoriphagus TaxID=2641541 RepID=UPI000C4D8347|nr:MULTISPECIES: DUF4221 family protein [unclassified Algoriphagus]MAL15535.1 hypothetical protein [Algoriphagus sp.]QYH39058.1 DUF4221 domain-containing protein [Algoriphagus sp. NBT04N3]HAS57596.1 hypothetical protein [Algoriphagus sp.]HCB47632.1 hypothetical protein [Algoriphagus sp.]HCD89612.1 hypothetical protein [Algoriphagus sp.]|tara:strand:- start:229 stop:1374 length:1146 start_codon:yes stop_codon:yes gene_type:complete
MRYLFLFAIIPFLFSCGKTDDKGGFSGEIKLSIDTVMVDAGEEFLSLNYDLNFSSLSPDKSYLINFNPESQVAERIDLNELKLVRKIQYEAEGPDGIGSRTASFSILPNENLLFKNYMVYKVHDQKGKLVENLELEKIASDILGETNYYPLQVFRIKDNPTRVFVLTLHWENYSYSLIDFNLSERTYKEIPLPIFDKGRDYRLEILYNGNPAGGYGPSVYSSLENNRIYMTMNAFNEVHVFDLEKDSLYSKTWDSPLLGSKSTYKPPKEVEMTSGELKEITRKAQEDISYKHLIWDDRKNVFYRFSEKKKFSEEINEYDEYTVTGSTLYLSVFDQDLNLLIESEIPELTSLSSRYFVKDGAIWMYSNIDDELAFTRINFVD